MHLLLCFYYFLSLYKKFCRTILSVHHQNYGQTVDLQNLKSSKKQKTFLLTAILSALPAVTTTTTTTTTMILTTTLIQHTLQHQSLNTRPSHYKRSSSSQARCRSRIKGLLILLFKLNSLQGCSRWRLASRGWQSVGRLPIKLFQSSLIFCFSIFLFIILVSNINPSKKPKIKKMNKLFFIFYIVNYKTL